MKSKDNMNINRLFLCVSFMVLLVMGTAERGEALYETGVKNTGLGHTGVSYYADSSSPLYNPALLALSPRGKFGLGYTYSAKKQFDLFDAGYQCGLDRGSALGFNFVYYKPKEEVVYDSDDRIQEVLKESRNAFNIGSGFTIRPFMLGLNFRIVNYQKEGDSSTLASFDAGLVYLLSFLSRNLYAGMNLMNALKTTGELNGRTIYEPFNFKVGLSCRFPSPKHAFLIAAELNSRKADYPLAGFGLEYTLYRVFSIRAGYNEKEQFTTGAGSQYGPFSLDYSFEREKQNGTVNHRISFTYLFPAQLSTAEKEIYYERGIRYYNDFNFQKAFQYFKPLYFSDKTFRETEYYYLLLEKRLIQKKQEEEKHFREADGLYQEAVAYYKQKENTKAINKLAECLKKNRNHQDARVLLHRISRIEKDRRDQEQARTREKEGDAYFLQAGYPSALVEYKEALRLDPDNQELAGKIEAAKTELSRLDARAIAMKLYREGEDFYKAGAYPKAIMKWNEALAANPSFSGIQDKIRDAQNKLQSMEEERVLDKVTADKINGLKATARGKYDRKEFQQALFDIEEILALNPDDADMKNLKSSVLGRINEKEQQEASRKSIQANEHFSRAVRTDPVLSPEEIGYHLSVVVAANPSRGRPLKELNTLLIRIGSMQASGGAKNSSEYRLMMQHFRKGTDYYQKNDLESAYQEWRRGAGIIVPESGRTAADASLSDARKSQEEKYILYQLTLSGKLLNEGKKIQALEEAQKVLALRPDNSAAAEIIKNCVTGTNKTGLVRERLKKAEELALKSQYADAVSEVKLVLAMDGGNKTARDRLLEYETSLNKLKAASEPQNNLELAYNYYSSGNYNNAKEVVNRILEADKGNVKAKKLLEKIEEKEVDTDLDRINRKKIMELYGQGVNLFIGKDYDGCLKTMKTIVEMDPDNIQALKFIEKAKARIAEKTESAAVRKGTPADKKLVWQYYVKGINYYMNNELDKAIAEWRRALKLDPTNSKIKVALEKAVIKKEVLEQY